jgi:L-lysine 6-transaminase
MRITESSPPSRSIVAHDVEPAEVIARLDRHLLVDGYPIVVDLERSEGSWLVDQVSGRRYLDLFTFFASAPIGHNHPRLREPDVQRRILRAATSNPSNSDFYTVEMAAFVDTLYRVGRLADLPHLFLVAGGAPAVENALKVAFDWKAQRNLARGIDGPRHLRVLHFEEAFHGRLGYSLSVTATPDDRKTRHFPTFDWPRIANPKLRFPLDGDARREVVELERCALADIERAFDDDADGIAAIIIEPIQGEGGDNHFRGEFLAALRRVADQRQALLVFDEIQTGVGATGAMWAHEHFAVRPDILVFGKKLQVCGICVSRRIDEVERNVFVESSRINSTWGGTLIDMLRGAEYLRVIEAEDLVANARRQGERLLAGIEALAGELPSAVVNPRGRGLMCAFDLAGGLSRPELLAACLERELIVAPTGARGIRFRPALNVGEREIDAGLDRIGDALHALSRQRRA